MDARQKPSPPGVEDSDALSTHLSAPIEVGEPDVAGPTVTLDDGGGT